MERETHKCSKCGRHKAYTDFYRAHPGTGWLDAEGHKRRSRCKTCSKAAERERWQNRQETAVVSQMLQSARKRALNKGIEFSLTPVDVIIPSRCPVLDIPLYSSPYGTRHPVDNSPTLDRIVNEKGYVPGNVIVVSWLANRIKNTATPEMLRRVARFYEKLAEQEQDRCDVSEPAVPYFKRVAGQDLTG